MNSMIARLLTYFCAVVALVSTTSASAAVVSGTYTGDGSASRTITVGFQPDLVMVQRFDSAIQPMHIRTKDMTFSQSMASTSSAPFSVVDITGLTSTGFTLGSGNSNTSGIKYYYFAISETPGEIKIGTYTGNGTDNRNITGIGFQPSFVMAISQSRSTVFKTATMAGELSLTWDSTNATNIIQALGVDGFQVGSDGMVNANASPYFFIACKEVAGKFKTGTYTGNGTGQSITTVGFQPEGVFIKRDGTTGPGIKWAASGLTTDESITANFTAGPITGAITSILSNGFTLGATGGRVNANLAAYHYFAFAPQAATAPAPVVTNVTSSTANGSYGATQLVSIQVAFNAPVTVTGAPALALNSGGTATYASGSPGTTLTFNYTIGAGQTSADLDYSATTSLTLSGGAIVAATGGTPATLTLPAPGAAGSLGANKAIVIDTTAPTNTILSATFSNDTGFSSTDFITSSTSQSISGTLSAAMVPGESVEVSLDNGSTWSTAATVVAQNTWTLSGQTLVSSNTLRARVKDLAGNTGLVFSQAYVLDTTAPTITIGAPSASSVAAGGTVTYTVTYADANFRSSTLGSGNITLNSTGTAGGTVAVSGSGTTRTVTISSITGAGTLGISIASGTASDSAGNNAPAAGPSTTFTVVAPPAVTSINPTSGSTAGGTAVTITGTGFTGAGGATVGGVPLTGVTVNATTITGTTGAHAAGAVDVVITGSPNGASTGGTGIYTYMATAEIPTTLSSGTLTIDATGAPGAAQTSVSIVDLGGGVFVIEIKDLTRTIGAPTGGSQVDSHTVRIPIGSVSNIVINGTPLGDTFTLDLSLGTLPGLVTVNGNAPTSSPGDSLRVIGAYDDITYGPNGIGSGTLDVDGTQVAFTGLEPLDFSSSTIVNFTLVVDPTSAFAGDVITTVAAVDAGVNTLVTFTDAAGVPNGLESYKIGALTGTFTIEGDNVDDDFFSLQGLGSAMAGHVSVDGMGGNADVIQVYNATFAVTGTDKSLSLKADFIGVTQTQSADTTPDDPGILRATGNITLEANGDDTVTTPPLWGTSGVWGTTPPTHYNATSLATRGNLLLMGHIEKTAGSDATLTLRANRNVAVVLAGAVGNTGGRIISTTNKLHTIINSDRDALNAGATLITTFAQVLTNGGDITIGGGANPATTAAKGLSGQATGVAIQGATLDSSGGNISIRGTGADASNGLGVNFSSSALKNNGLISSGAGNINIVGTGGNGTNAHALRIAGDTSTPTPGFATIQSTTGTITLSGTSVIASGFGVTSSSNTSITSTGGSAVSITGISPGTQAIILSPVSPSSAIINSTNGQVTLSADTMNLNGNTGTESITAGTGTVTLKPTTAGKNIELGSGVVDSGTLLAIDSSTELPNITAGTVAIGEVASGTLTVSSIIAPSTFTTLALASGSGTTFSSAGGFAAHVTTASNYEKITVIGTATIAPGATFATSSAGGYVWNGTDTFTFLDNDAADAITGTFSGPSLAPFLGSALMATESYAAGTGNDFLVGNVIPVVTNVSPATGSLAGGGTVVLTGSNFTGATAVSFGGVAAASFMVDSGTQITATTPAHAAGVVSVDVTTPAGTNVANTLFTYAAPPTVSSSTATVASNAATLIITGTGFDTTPGNNTVVFNNGAVGTVTAATATQLTVSFTTQPTSFGGLTAVVTNGSGSSGAAVQVANVANIVATLTGGDLVITDVANGNDTLSLSGTAGNLVIAADLASVISSNAGTGSGTSTVTIPLSSITGSITVNAAGGGDSINFGLFSAPLPSLTVNGDAGTDVVNFTGALTVSTGAVTAETINVPGALRSSSGGLTLTASAGVTVNGAADGGPGALTINSDSDADGSGSLVVGAAGTLDGVTIVVQAGDVDIASTARVGNTSTLPIITTFINDTQGLSLPTGMEFDNAGNLYVADQGNNTVFKVTPGAVVSTVASSATLLGVGMQTAEGLAINADNDLFITNGSNNPGSVARITSLGVASNFASGIPANHDATFDGAGNLYVVSGNTGPSTQIMSKITPLGGVSTFVASPLLAYPTDVEINASGDLYVAGWGAGVIYKVTPAGAVSTFASPGGHPTRLDFDSSGNLYFIEQGGNFVKMVTPAGAVSTYASGAALSGTSGIAVDATGTIWVGKDNHTIVKVSPPTAITTAVTVKPSKATQPISLGATVLASLNLTDAELDRVFVATLTIGDSASGGITISAPISPANYTTLALGQDTTFAATGGFVADVTSASVYEKITVDGTVTITAGATFAANAISPYVWNGTDAFIFLVNDGSDAITGTFTGPTLTNFLGSTLTAARSFTTGTGNDFGTTPVAPVVISIAPSSGSTAGGTPVTITGTGFTGASGASVGGVSLSSFSVVNDTTITGTTGAHAAGAVDVAITGVPGGASTGGTGIFTYALPSLFTEPFSSVSGGTFNGGQYQTGLDLNFNANLAGWTKAGFDAIHLVDLANLASSVTNPRNYAAMIYDDNVLTQNTAISGSNTALRNYRVTLKVSPAVYQIAGEATLSGGQLLIEVVRGNNTVLASHSFTPGAWAGSMSFTPGSFDYVGDGSGDVHLRIGPAPGSFGNGRFAGALDDLTVLDMGTFVPTITAASPSTGSVVGGTSVVITGTGFTGATSVTFAGVAATAFTVDSDTQITATTPAGGGGTSRRARHHFRWRQHTAPSDNSDRGA